MGRVIIAITILTIVLIGAGVLIYFRSKKSKELAQEKGWAMAGDLNAADEHQIIQLNQAAAVLLAEMLTIPVEVMRWDPDNVTIVGTAHREQAQQWLQQNAEITARSRKKLRRG